jgi:hypothetical protein
MPFRSLMLTPSHSRALSIWFYSGTILTFLRTFLLEYPESQLEQGSLCLNNLRW